MARLTRGTERSFDRFVFFSDAVVAIAITLLILPLVDSVSDAGTVSHLLRDNAAQFVAFGLSFVVIAMFWIAHHALFERVDRVNSLLLWVNMAWLASIVFLPFPTELLSVRGTKEAVVRFVYIASVLAISTLLLALEIVMRKNPQLWTEGAGFDYSVANGIINVILLVIALIVGTAISAIGMWSMLLLFVADPLARRIDRRRAAG